MLQRCELGSSSEEKTSEEKKAGKGKKDETDEPRKAKGKTKKVEVDDDEDPPKTMKRPAAKRFKKDEFDGLFDDFQRGDDGDNSGPDADEGEGEVEDKKKSKRRKKDDGDEKKSRKKQECHKLPVSDLLSVSP